MVSGSDANIVEFGDSFLVLWYGVTRNTPRFRMRCAVQTRRVSRPIVLARMGAYVDVEVPISEIVGDLGCLERTSCNIPLLKSRCSITMMINANVGNR